MELLIAVLCVGEGGWTRLSHFRPVRGTAKTVKASPASASPLLPAPAPAIPSARPFWRLLHLERVSSRSYPRPCIPGVCPPPHLSPLLSRLCSRSTTLAASSRRDAVAAARRPLGRPACLLAVPRLATGPPPLGRHSPLPASPSPSPPLRLGCVAGGGCRRPPHGPPAAVAAWLVARGGVSPPHRPHPACNFLHRGHPV